MRRQVVAGALASLLWAGGVLADCWEEAARRHDLEPQLLLAIAQVESGFKVDALHVNRDGSRDIGLMQINSQHLPRLSRRGITEPLLLSDPVSRWRQGPLFLPNSSPVMAITGRRLARTTRAVRLRAKPFDCVMRARSGRIITPGKCRAGPRAECDRIILMNCRV